LTLDGIMFLPTGTGDFLLTGTGDFLPAGTGDVAKVTDFRSFRSFNLSSNLDWRTTMTEVTDNAGLSRYEMAVDGVTAFVIYARQGDEITLVHTEVPQALGGRGIGSALATGVLEDIRSRGLRVVPECEFIAAFIQRHREFADLVVRRDDAS
jgi:uncharacterized protein